MANEIAGADYEVLGKRFESVVTYACLATLLSFLFGFLSQHAYEHMAWMALGIEDQGPWKDIQNISSLSLARGFRYFLAFLFIGLFYLTLEHLKKPSLVAGLFLSTLVVPLCLPPVLFFMTSGEFKGQFLVWGMWAIVCALFYWQAKFSASWKIDAVIAILFTFSVGRLVALDHALWQAVLHAKALELGIAIPGGSKAYFITAESVYIAGQFLTGYLLPRTLIRSLSGSSEVASRTAGELA